MNPAVRSAGCEVRSETTHSAREEVDRSGAAPRTGAVGPEVARLWDALREVMDPEIPISLVDMGLVYDIRLEDGTVEVDLTYTATGCPCTHFIKWDIAERLQREPGIEDIRINEVWNPPWTKARITPEGRAQMKKWGVSL